MKKSNPICLILVAICFISSCKSQNNIAKVNFLVGTWKMENKATFEEWKPLENGLVGGSFKIKEGIRQVLETLLIKNNDGEIVYEATVPDQNDGQTIAFILNTSVTDKLSFENLEHDFPKKIQYQKISDTKIFVQVMGENDQGFSYYLVKQ